MKKETRANDLGFLGTIGDHRKRLTGSICHLSNYQKGSYINKNNGFRSYITEAAFLNLDQTFSIVDVNCHVNLLAFGETYSGNTQHCMQHIVHLIKLLE